MLNLPVEHLILAVRPLTAREFVTSFSPLQQLSDANLKNAYKLKKNIKTLLKFNP